MVIAIILIVVTVCYQVVEPIDPLVFILHLTPLSILIAALFEGLLPGIIICGAFTICGSVFAGSDIAAILVSNAALLSLGLWFHYRDLLRDGLLLIMGRGLLLITVHTGLFVLVYHGRGHELAVSGTVVTYLGTLLSAALVILIAFKVKNQEQLQEELYKVEKYHMIGQMAASISHEIRNPLTSTRGFLQMMGKTNISNESLERYRLHAIEGVEHANAIITDYLNYAKPTIEEARLIDVNAEIEGLVPLITPLSVMAGIEVRIAHQQKQKAYILGELKKFQQCLLNLMKNAIEAMPEGGVLSVSTRIDSERVYIQIADTGVGMTKRQLKRIGTPFFTTKEKGTGLGLMVVVSLVKVMGGQITFSSRSGKGTVCEIRYELHKP
ncbi:ATP-binding protein [Paenibacillus silvisoli]|uniref:ATP-binding protein n=1 Tax=Paenibacillus silvisoli TaxID=3110539 RepID=UPI002803F6BA|nr:ATP-binding protein [Paenibacillus silvisoli]